MEKNLKQQQSDCLRIVLFGPESTGKTTLAKALATYYDSSYVPEFARDYLQKKWDTTQEVCTLEDLLVIVKGQLDIENPNKYRDQQQSGQQQSQSPFKELSASLSSALSDAEEKAEPLPDDAMSSTQRSSSGKAGYCYIGEDRGFRSCIQVKEGDTCMSGEIFPSSAICVNPSLRE